jgi:hypothetical protein
MARGECNCGAVAFEADADLSGVFVCHCSICRRSTGNNGIAGTGASRDPSPGQAPTHAGRGHGGSPDRGMCLA